MGHTDAGLALRIYAQAMRSEADKAGRLLALVQGSLDSESHIPAAPIGEAHSG